MTFSQIQPFLGSLGCPKVFGQTDTHAHMTNAEGDLTLNIQKLFEYT